ncbi:hypothetical protein SUGI_0448710 [Cryptomeria japonica]|uniref:heat shock protein 90-5, chloroplastic n=1 Tax=Cryptomeria japonica TaxID=3369 RepID=UPI002408ECB9|nr:heat shock protein 90-5, chloroplastic [Cryptomeria japonica]GLJ23692.1 hypothetical protein SUGI_0448710 [Cryptomeria japonica]
MYQASRRSISAAVRAPALIRGSAVPVTSSPYCAFEKIIDNNDGGNTAPPSFSSPRFLSTLTLGSAGSIKPGILTSALPFGSRFMILPGSVRGEATVAEVETTEGPVEKYEYQAEVSRLLDLIVHSLYSHKEVFLRELISNASDALDKLRFLSVTEPSLLGNGGELEIRVKADKENGTITLLDSGIGMTKEELVDCLGTIAQSGTAKFMKALKDSKEAGSDNLIGQFGVGFYSAFLVSDKIVVSTKSPKSDKQYVWEGQADTSSYVIREETIPDKLIPRGTSITLHLKTEDKLEYADSEKLMSLVKNYSQFVSFPIYIWKEKTQAIEVEVDDEAKEGEAIAPEGQKKKKTKTITEKYSDWELANETEPIWMRNTKSVSTEEYNEFYKKTFNEYMDPLACTHFNTEGEVEFRGILYIPAIAPMGREDIANPKTKNIRLYVKRVFISDDFDGELFPRYLGFVKGVVDSNDLPLNVSREILQESRIVRVMRKRLLKKTFEMISGIALSEDKEDYKKFWDNFGKNLKIGVIEDNSNHKKLAPLLRFFSSYSEDELISLDQYVDSMKEGQKDIYYIASDSITSARDAPFLEKLLEKEYEVLYLVDPIDEVTIQNLKSYKDKSFVDITKEDLDLGDRDEAKEKQVKKEFLSFCDWMKDHLGDKVAKVDISNRLSSSPCVLVSGRFGWSANMERLMKAQTMGDTSSMEFMRSRRILEINPEHAIIKNLNAACKDAPKSQDALKAIDLLYDTALISSGFTPENPAELGGKIYSMMDIALAGKWAGSTTEGFNDNASESSSAVGVEETEVIESVQKQETPSEVNEASEAEIIESAEVQAESTSSKK